MRAFRAFDEFELAVFPHMDMLYNYAVKMTGSKWSITALCQLGSEDSRTWQSATLVGTGSQPIWITAAFTAHIHGHRRPDSANIFGIVRRPQSNSTASNNGWIPGYRAQNRRLMHP